MSYNKSIHRTDNAYLITIELPGVKIENIELAVQGNRLHVKAERKRPKATPLHLESSSQSYRTHFPLGVDIDEESIEAKLINGVLYIELQRKAKQYRIPIKAA